MKILNITKKFEHNIYGGVENLVDSLCNELQKKNIFSEVYTVKEKKTKKRNYKIFSDKLLINVLSCPVSFKSLINFNRLKQNYDFFNFHFPWPFMDILSMFVPRKKIVTTYHADIVKKNLFYYLYFPLMMIFLIRSKKIIVTSKNYLNSSKILKYFNKKIVIIPIGIKKRNKLNNIKKNLRIYKYKEYFIFVGSLRNYKGLDYLIDAFSELNINLLIVGNGKEKKYINNKIKNIQNIKLIINTDEDNKFFLIRHSQALILPSTDRREAYGIALIEALSEKKTIISTKISSGTSFINRHNHTGIEIHPSNKDEIKYSVNKIQNNKQLRKKFEKNSYSRYENTFKLEIMIKKYRNFFYKLKEIN
jgi:O-antigen biosynthesis alpha-1,3-mannosyltransferase